ncbi:hypothetical protein COCON_G00193090 [Conger conger]|uniref:Max-binding protein MNT n=1 Tax=Conger conger TaxID=82655 RepID=A0A9Q1D464_CONCO|nr:hypothetical protein COCON_G00193090 [Conger conger]
MSIETLLEAAKFLEWQALQQQKTREEEELRLTQGVEQKPAEVTSLVQPVGVNHVTWPGKFCPEPCPSPLPPPAVPPPVPITVIPIPVLSASPKLLPPLPGTALAPSTEPRPSPLRPPPPQHQVLPLLAPQGQGECPSLPQALNPTTPNHQLYPSPTPPASQHAPLLQAPPSPALRPLAMDDRNLDAKKRPGGAGTREVHNKLEKNRRAHLKECFETLKKTVPAVDEKKTSNLSVLRSALRYIQTLKRKEKEYEHEMERLAREKISTQQRLVELKNELGQWMNVIEMERVLRLTEQPEDDQASTSTASEGEDNVEENTEDLQPPSKVPHMATVSPSIASQLQPPQPLVQISVALPVQSHAHTQVVTAPSMPSVIAHASVIQAGSKHVGHLAPSPAPQAIGPPPSSVPQAIGPTPSPAAQAIGHTPSSVPQSIGPASQPISHITVHPVAHLYPPTAMMSHLAHTLSHTQLNTLSPAQVNCQPAVVTHHSQLVGQTVLNPVTMVTMPSFPVGRLKLA